MKADLSDIIRGFDPDNDVVKEPPPTPVSLPRPVVVAIERMPIRRSPTGSGKPRSGLMNDMLLALSNGPVSLSVLMKMGKTKRSYYSRASEMRVEGLIQDAVMLTPEGEKRARALLDQHAAWNERIARKGRRRGRT